MDEQKIFETLIENVPEKKHGIYGGHQLQSTKALTIASIIIGAAFIVSAIILANR